ncbi:hypothetical protein SOCEGT47_084220 [Sorangium cellulosum]|uniref:DUF2750 domain-containing protein n=1 Tax=Sorangium cellulosum TaxID=56 RepID=A0A4P2QDG0_SORCE|nr:DUF2750 domain-containing protein [Sorangium cellulosum]AUX27824.1 hypothetical protein SOCEGT47_084220 [Sorangium cellulosum]
MRRTSEHEIQAVLRLDGPERFRHFVKRVADDQIAWGLWQDGWALMANADGCQVFPLWPAREYAEIHREGEWAAYEARKIPLADLLDELLPRLAESGILPGVFPTPSGKGVTPGPEELAGALRKELENYE